MGVKRLRDIPGFSIDRVAQAAGNDPEILRLENLDTDLRPPPAAIEATTQALHRDEDNSYLPFTGRLDLRREVARKLSRQTGQPYHAEQVTITCGGTEGLLDALLATTDPGDEVVLTDPTYAGMINRVRLVGAKPVWAPFRIVDQHWRLDLEALTAAITPRTRALFIMNPSMPSGAVLRQETWHTIAELCGKHDLWLIYNAAMERILFDDRPVIHPASLPQLRRRTLTVGSVSKEFRMIGWRVGWVAGPQAVMDDVARVHIYNAVTATGIGQAGAMVALNESPEAFKTCLRTWQQRRDILNRQLHGLPTVPAAGGWSQLLDVDAMGFDARQASQRLLELGKVAATPMTHWGHENGDRFVRLVFSNEPVERLADLGARVRRALT